MPDTEFVVNRGRGLENALDQLERGEVESFVIDRGRGPVTVLIPYWRGLQLRDFLKGDRVPTGEDALNPEAWDRI